MREAELDRVVNDIADGEGGESSEIAAVSMFGEEREAWEKDQAQQQVREIR